MHSGSRHPHGNVANSCQRYGLLRGAVGAAFVSVPSTVARLASSGGLEPTASEIATATVAVLGGRHLLESVLLLRYPRPAVTRTVMFFDLLHATSMLALASRSETYRRPALVSAVTATTLAGLGARAVGSRRQATP